MKILIVEDDPDQLALAARYIEEDLQAETLRAESRSAALDFLRMNKDVALILSDIQLPDGTGIGLCKQIKALDAFESMPVVFMTAYDDLDNVQGAFAVGAIDFIVKPLDRVELITRVQKALALKNGSGREKRSHPRSTEYASLWLSERDDDTRYLSPLVEDFSAAGLRVVLPEDGDISSDEISILFSIPGQRDLLEIKGRVVRRGQNELGATELGIQFEDITDEARELLDVRARALGSKDRRSQGH